MRVRELLRDARYGLPQKIERLSAGPRGSAAIRRCETLQCLGIAATVGYFQASNASPDDILAANLTLLSDWNASGGEDYLSVKAPPLHFDSQRLEKLAAAAAAAGISLLFDAHAPKDAEATLASVALLKPRYPLTGFALPARWRRSPSDAIRFRDSPARIRIVKGEWADPEFSEDIEAAYLSLAARLAGRQAPVAIATHDPLLAQRALSLLLSAGTPCELEQLRGLPSRRTRAVASQLGVPVRVYVPFGPGWWPYALDKALGRPYLLSWIIRDCLGRRPRVSRAGAPNHALGS